MRLLFLTLKKIKSIADEDLYMDLMREFARRGHEVFLVTPLEKKEGRESGLRREGRIHLLSCRTGNLFGVGMIEKAISQMGLPRRYEKEIGRFFPGISFDLILYSTPPITLASVIERLKKKTGARTYLLLKDIFPQNAVDIGILSPFAAKLFFRRKERKLYAISDRIGCMSPANVSYLLKHNPIDVNKVEVCPNSISVKRGKRTPADRRALCAAFGMKPDRLLFIYGGNLGLPQGIPFLISCIERLRAEKKVHFVICGDGTEFPKLESYLKEEIPENLTLIRGLPKRRYDDLVSICDVGMIFLDRRFTIPNFPSRLLSYLEAGLPVLVCADEVTDMGRIAEENEFGVKVSGESTESFLEAVLQFFDEEKRKRMGRNGRLFLEENYTAEKSCDIILGSRNAERREK